MNFSQILLNSMLAALFATGMAILLTAPYQYLVSTFLCGFTGRFVRDVMMGWGMSQNWSTVVASAVLVLVAVAITQRHRISPVVLICGVLPLAASVAIFNLLFELMKLTTLNGESLIAATIAFCSNAAKTFIGTLAIALGLEVGLAIARLISREEVEDV